MATSCIIPVVLSGGAGTRLWPMSREHYPKQLLALQGAGESMLQATLLRTRGLSDTAAPIVISNEEHRFLVAEQLRGVEAHSSEIVLEPCGRGTAAAVALAAHASLSRAPSGADPLLLILPADHLITDPAEFCRVVASAVDIARRGKLVTFGIRPDKPETGYGYIVRGHEVDASASFEIDRFVEKPPRELAERLVASGGCYWNSGMFLMSATVYLAELAAHAPDIATSCQSAWDSRRVDVDFIRPDRQTFELCRNDSIDYAVMEKTHNAVVIPMDAGWSDVGSWSSLQESLPLDAQGNALRGDVLSVDTTGSLVISEHRLVAVLGLRDQVVVETKDAVLIADKARVQDVKSIVSTLKSLGRSEHVAHREVHRPWGTYDSIENGVGYQVKRITLKPGAAISLQLHHRRSEHWIVVEGSARVTRGEEVFTLGVNESTYIPAGAKHRIENVTQAPLKFIEVQSGDYLGEDDIERFEDRYGRQGATN